MTNTFSLARKRLGIYINTPEFSWSSQLAKGATPPKGYVEALLKASKAFNDNYPVKNAKEREEEKPK